MFDFVKRDVYQKELEARIRAEVERDTTTAENDRLLELIEAERLAHHEEIKSHREQIDSILDRFAPNLAAQAIPTDHTEGAGGLDGLTLEQQLAIELTSPAAGRTQIDAKRMRIDAIRAQIRFRDSGGGTHTDDLSPAELLRVEEAVK